jgi:hypothetical protein
VTAGACCWEFQVVAGFRASAVVTAAGCMWTTGKHDSGMLAGSSATDALVWAPAVLPPRCAVAAAAMGGRVAAAVTTTGELLVWGPLLGGEKGAPRLPTLPRIWGLVTSVSAGNQHISGCTEDGVLWAMGHRATCLGSTPAPAPSANLSSSSTVLREPVSMVHDVRATSGGGGGGGGSVSKAVAAPAVAVAAGYAHTAALVATCSMAMAAPIARQPATTACVLEWSGGGGSGRSYELMVEPEGWAVHAADAAVNEARVVYTGSALVFRLPLPETTNPDDAGRFRARVRMAGGPWSAWAQVRISALGTICRQRAWELPGMCCVGEQASA